MYIPRKQTEKSTYKLHGIKETRATSSEQWQPGIATTINTYLLFEYSNYRNTDFQDKLEHPTNVDGLGAIVGPWFATLHKSTAAIIAV